jgi:hypothetical protein
MNLERAAYWILGLTGLAWVVMAVMETDFGTPEAVLGWVSVGGFALLFLKALRDRMGSAEDDHYDRTVER